MGILSWVIFGLIAGGIAKLLMPGKDPGGCFITMILGILGANLGGFVGSYLLGWGTINEFNFKNMLLAVLGAVLLLVIYRLVFQKKK